MAKPKPIQNPPLPPSDLQDGFAEVLKALLLPDSVPTESEAWLTFYFHCAAATVIPIGPFVPGSKIRQILQTGGDFVFVSVTPETASTISLKAATSSVLAMCYANNVQNVGNLQVPIPPGQVWLNVAAATNVWLAISSPRGQQP